MLSEIWNSRSSMDKPKLQSSSKFSILRHGPVFFPNSILMKKNYFTERVGGEKQIIVDLFYLSDLP
jgi:hypothetical protein